MRARLLGAVQFLTALPVHAATASPGKSALFFPLMGAALGAAGGALIETVARYVPFTLVCLLVLAFWTVITGGLHEDGFADVADAVRSWRSPQKIHSILKDSRIGAHGAMALLLLVLIRWQALAAIAVQPIPSLAAALALSRAAMVAMIWTTPAAGAGSALHFSATLDSWTAAGAIAQGIAFAFLPGIGTGLYLLSASVITLVVARRWFMRTLGGVTGDCIGATSQILETICLIIFTCRPCIS